MRRSWPRSPRPSGNSPRRSTGWRCTAGSPSSPGRVRTWSRCTRRMSSGYWPPVGSDRFRRLEMVPAQRRAVLGSFWSNNEEHSRRLLRDVREEMPELVARVHSDAVCAPRGVAWVGDVLLPSRTPSRGGSTCSARAPSTPARVSPGSRARRAGWTARTSTSTTRSRGTPGTSPPRISRSSGRGTRRRPPTPDLRVIASNLAGSTELLPFQSQGARRLRHRPGRTSRSSPVRCGWSVW